LELAAARVQALTVEEISARLDHRFRLLSGGSRTVLAHHRTLRAAIDWSHDLLTEPERVLLRRLGVFSGGFTLAAAEQVCALSVIESENVLELLSGLVTRSLVLLERSGREGRYRLLETIREYAFEKLVAAGEESVLRERHLAWCVGFAERAEPELRGREQQHWLGQLQAELDNFRAAFSWALFTKNPVQALRLASTLLEFWIVRADWSEGRAWVEAALDLPGKVEGAVQMKALRAAAELADVLSDYPRATAHYEASLAVARELGDKRGIAAALLGLAHESQRVGTFAMARPLVEESVALFRDLGDEPSLARSLGGLAWLEERYPRTRSLWEQNLAIRRRLGNRESVGWSAINVGLAAQETGDYPAARAAYEESLAIGRELDYKRMVARALTQLGEVARLEGNMAEARALFEQTLPTWREIGHKSGLVDALRGLGDAARLEGAFASAQSLLEESLTVCREIGARPGIAAALESLANLAAARGDRERAKCHYGEALSLWTVMDHAHGFARCMRGLAELVVAEGRFGVAAMLIGGSESLREQIGAAVPPAERPRHDRVVIIARERLGETAFTAKWEEGWSLGRRMAALALEE
jgi:tetratricopeptide (TPR) repeat protein